MGLAGLVLIGPTHSCGADVFPPADARAQNTFAHAEEKLKEHKKLDAIDDLKKADKQDRHYSASCAEGEDAIPQQESRTCLQ
jgi:hypothetical protein